ncbi:1,5-anhydro-D-fructose reductase [Armadillidium nasatum]|uniref:1,5-anhydro-D-fructose reductase n=1 Tax=Armadillidium nasatum TaxID=96803 RepID=A0A5N5SMG1_9CRUS|nr:1,5-anhydro-D-fructose reductase [Armadillidium nasatum]
MDFDTDLEALWKALEQEVKAGRVKSLGLSNFNSVQVQRIMKIAEIPPAANQVEIHLYFQQRPLVELCQKLGIAMVSYGSVGGPHTGGGKTMTLLKDPIVLEIAKKYGKTPGQIVLKALVQRDIIVIPKSITPERIKSNIDIFNFQLTDEDLQKLAKLDKGKSGRFYDFKTDFKGCLKHKEYPFHIDF